MSKNGFLHAEGLKICEGNGQAILLKGWGLGNWLLPEGYMWLCGDSKSFDRPRRIEAAIAEMTGPEYAARFWKAFRDTYITREDIRYMRELGYNSVRVPMNWRIFMEEGNGIAFRESGFALLDRLLDWCEKFGMYAFLDLHGAPGGQTGANIDDCENDVPELFLNEDFWRKGVALWRELARRYGDRTIVGGYDLLNEPIRPGDDNLQDYDHLFPKLMDFYRDCIAAVREVDKNHMFTLEGPHWATEFSCFTEKPDDNMALHFHRYWMEPDMAALEPYLRKSKELGAPLWLGETGENTNEWYAAMYPLCESLGIGYNLWPWKKMRCTNSPCSIRPPEDYELVLDHVKNGAPLSQGKAQSIFNGYLENCKLENCDLHPEVTAAVFGQL